MEAYIGVNVKFLIVPTNILIPAIAYIPKLVNFKTKNNNNTFKKPKHIVTIEFTFNLLVIVKVSNKLFIAAETIPPAIVITVNDILIIHFD